MEISFATSTIRRQCESAEELITAHGRPCAERAMSRLLDVDAATCLADLAVLPGACRALGGEDSGRFALDLTDAKALVLESSTTARVGGAGEVDWTRVTSVRIIAIANNDMLESGAASSRSATKP
jgi:hypothetical protein